MLVPYRNANGDVINVVVQGPQTPTDRSGTIAGAATQILMAANPYRSGWLFQNRSLLGNVMLINDLGGDATLAGAIALYPGESFPPPGYPVTGGVIQIAGTANDPFTAREW